MQRKTESNTGFATALALTGLLMLAGCSSGDSPSGPSGSANLRGRLAKSVSSRSVAARSGAGAGSVAAVGAEIILDGVPTGSFTDAEGEFALNVTAGTHTISVSLNGVTSEAITVEMPVDGTVELEVELLPDGSLSAEEDVDHDGDVDGQDDLDHDGDIGDDDDDLDHDGDSGDDDDEIAGDHDDEDEEIAGDHDDEDGEDDDDEIDGDEEDEDDQDQGAGAGLKG